MCTYEFLTFCMMFVLSVSDSWWGHLGVPAGTGGRTVRGRSRGSTRGSDTEQQPPPGVSLLPEHIRHSHGTNQLLYASWLRDGGSDIPAQQGEEYLLFLFDFQWRHSSMFGDVSVLFCGDVCLESEDHLTQLQIRFDTALLQRSEIWGYLNSVQWTWSLSRQKCYKSTL